MKRNLILLLLAFLISGCSGAQSVLDANGHAAIVLKELILAMVLACSAVWFLVMIALVSALARRRDQATGAISERRATVAVSGAVGATVLVVSGLTIASFYTTRALSEAEDPELTIVVRAQQWWWQFTYVDPRSTQTFVTANELHIPIGKDVRLRLESSDVIHSFWVPSLAGKQDLIPGRENILTLRAERPGVYRGQCAEFCGLQHSHMALFVVAEGEADYERWAEGQRGTSVEPSEAEAAAGKAVFMARQCAACHTIHGTGASGTTGPDLTHIGSRRTIAAGLLENTRGSLAAWIADPQTLKPGNNMPLVPLTSDELRQLAAYMEVLK
ncbi:cytochrome c oxidase subunit II [Sinorhizobium psoraleae]|uniref:Cytochrome aa3 subunit 2 n=1 Tax=Sinorhizobium psoraleae TaxID=520838 RepID=A0ABT4KHM4_9HYPH|nr:cytochrome c oxidase subunit II [Sinorhizobium psoraleae]MCZ4091329.1 cytochrome c oxidase subunit II [Sinorhizobium psoraleae]